MTTTHAGDLGPAIAAERESIEAEIADGTLLTAFAETARRHGDTQAYLWHRDGEWRTLTYAGLRDQVRDASLGLAAVGLRPGEFAVLWSRNRPEANIADMAVMHARGVPVFLYNTLTPGQAAYIAGHCEATVAIVEDRGFLARLDAVRARLPLLQRVVLIDGKPGPGEDWLIAWDALLDLGRAEAERSPGLFDATWRQVSPEDLAALIYTSGTTGPPKGVMITHHNVRYCAAAVLRVLPPEEFADSAGRRTVSYLPMAHASGRFSGQWLPMIYDATVAFCPDPAQLFQVAAQLRPTVLVGVPRVWEKLHTALRAGIAAESDPARRQAAEGQQAAQVGRALLAFAGLDSCRLAVSGAAPIDPEVIEFFQGLGLPMVEAWGMTELTNAATVSHPDQARNGAVGTACPGVEVRVAADGEVLIRGPLVMRGYYRDLVRTADALDQDGWLHTGDIGTLDTGGFLTIVDRKKELIITSGGKNISPVLIESLLQRHPLIGQACAIGDRRNYVTALLVLDAEVAPAWAQQQGIGTSDLAELAAHPRVLAEVEHGVRAANQNLARAEQVRRFALLPTEWTAETGELTPTFKRRRRIIIERHAPDIERLYGPVTTGVIDMEPG